MNILPMSVRLALQALVRQWFTEGGSAKSPAYHKIVSLEGREYEYAAGLMDGLAMCQTLLKVAS